jgi:hypothetical protein
MSYSFLADAVLVIHLAFILFVLLGAFLVLKWRWVAWLHLPAAFWGAYVEFSGRYCPLTPLENDLRQRAGEASYSGGFIDHYVTGWIYPDGLTREMQMVIGAIVVILNVVVYWFVIRSRRRDRWRLD